MGIACAECGKNNPLFGLSGARTFSARLVTMFIVNSSGTKFVMGGRLYAHFYVGDPIPIYGISDDP